MALACKNRANFFGVASGSLHRNWIDSGIQSIRLRGHQAASGQIGTAMSTSHASSSRMTVSATSMAASCLMIGLAPGVCYSGMAGIGEYSIRRAGTDARSNRHGVNATLQYNWSAFRFRTKAGHQD
jgi:hypothetical protein